MAVTAPTKAIHATLNNMTSKERHEARYKRRVATRNANKNKLMASYDDFERLFTFQNLWSCYKKCVLGVGWKASAQKYRNKPISNLAKTYNQLKIGTYKSNGFYAFDITERGKLRHIKSVHITERVVQRCLCDKSLIPALSPSLIYDNGACMKDKGIDFAKNRLNCHLQRYYREQGTNDGYAIVIDFSSFFDGILHETLRRKIESLYTDKRIIKLYMHFVKMFGDIGLGLGSQISQISAISYPNEVDYLIKACLKIKYYARYMDDSYIIHESKEYLNYCKDKITALCSELGIKLNTKKTQVVKLARGLPFLKQRFVLTRTGKVLRIPTKESEKRMRKKLKVFSRWLDCGKMNYEDVASSYNSWKSHLIRSNAYYRIRNMDRLFSKLINKGDIDMAVIKEYPYIDEDGKKHKDLEKHYSDEGKTLIQIETGSEYEQAIDVFPCKYNYIEKSEEISASEGVDETNDKPTDYS